MWLKEGSNQFLPTWKVVIVVLVGRERDREREVEFVSLCAKISVYFPSLVLFLPQSVLDVFNSAESPHDLPPLQETLPAVC